MNHDAARLLKIDGQLISDLDELDIVGSVIPGSPFYALVPARAGLDIRPGPVLIETQEGTRYPAEIERADAIPNQLGANVRVSGVLGES